MGFFNKKCDIDCCIDYGGRDEMYHRIAILTLVFMFGAIAPGFGQVLGSDEGHGDDAPSNKGLRYINPLVMEDAGRLADPAVVMFQGK